MQRYTEKMALHGAFPAWVHFKPSQPYTSSWNLKDVYRNTRGINRSGFKTTPIDTTINAFCMT